MWIYLVFGAIVSDCHLEYWQRQCVWNGQPKNRHEIRGLEKERNRERAKCHEVGVHDSHSLRWQYKIAYFFSAVVLFCTAEKIYNQIHCLVFGGLSLYDVILPLSPFDVISFTKIPINCQVMRWPQLLLFAIHLYVLDGALRFCNETNISIVMEREIFYCQKNREREYNIKWHHDSLQFPSHNENASKKQIYITSSRYNEHSTFRNWLFKVANYTKIYGHLNQGDFTKTVHLLQVFFFFCSTIRFVRATWMSQTLMYFLWIQWTLGTVFRNSSHKSHWEI